MYNFQQTTDLLGDVEAVSALPQLFSYDRITGELRWNQHPTQKHLAGRPVGTSRGRIKFNKRYYSIARLIWSWVEGKVCTHPYVLFRDGDVANLKWNNIYPSHRSVTPSKAAVADNTASEKFKGAVYEQTDMDDPVALFALAIKRVSEGLEMVTQETPSFGEIEEEANYLFKQELNYVKTKSD